MQLCFNLGYEFEIIIKLLFEKLNKFKKLNGIYEYLKEFLSYNYRKYF